MTPKEAIIKTMRLLRSRVIDYATPNDDIIKEVLGNDSNGWISVEEQLPPQRNEQISVPVLSYCDGVIERNEYIYSRGEWRWGNRNATHWMRLPQPPEKGDDELTKNDELTNKNMDYEKAYKDALGKAKECLQDGTIPAIARDYILEIFPELARLDPDMVRMLSITQWMPLPESPKGGEE